MFYNLFHQHCQTDTLEYDDGEFVLHVSLHIDGQYYFTIEKDNPSSDNANELSSQEPTTSSSNPSSDAVQIIKPVVSWDTLPIDSVIFSGISWILINE